MTAKKPPAEPARKAAAARRPTPATNEKAVTAFLGTVRADGALATLALTLARALDAGAGVSTATVAKELRATLAEIREGAVAADEQTSKADELRARRAARIANAANQ